MSIGGGSPYTRNHSRLFYYIMSISLLIENKHNLIFCSGKTFGKSQGKV
jgi:hypothetical protein